MHTFSNFSNILTILLFSTCLAFLRFFCHEALKTEKDRARASADVQSSQKTLAQRLPHFSALPQGNALRSIFLRVKSFVPGPVQTVQTSSISAVRSPENPSMQCRSKNEVKL